jgi:hypothetical protein
MSDASTLPAALVCFPGDDPWPAVQALCALHGRGTLALVCLYRTPERADATERLRRFCSRRWPSLPVVVPGDAGSPDAGRVVERLRDWRRFHPEIGRWVVDASAAGPAATTGLAQLAGRGEVALTMARSAAGAWEEWRPQGGLFGAVPLDPPLPADATDAMPVADVVPLLLRYEVEMSARESLEPERLSPADLARLVSSGPEHNWDWPAMYAALTGRPRGTTDLAFEHVLGATLHVLGIPNARIRFRVTRPAVRGCEQTFDVIAHAGGRLLAFDCQLRDESPEASAGRDQRILSELRAERIVVRPGRWATETERVLAAGSGVRLLDAEACRTLFSQLGALLRRDVPAELRELERGVLRPQAARLPVFTPATPAQLFSDAIHVDSCVFDLLRGARAEAQGALPPWTAARVAPDLWFLGGRVAAGGQPAELRQRLADKFAKARIEASFVFFELSGNRRAWRALLRVPGDGDAFGRWLRRWQNVPLIV